MGSADSDGGTADDGWAGHGGSDFEHASKILLRAGPGLTADDPLRRSESVDILARFLADNACASTLRMKTAGAVGKRLRETGHLDVALTLYDRLLDSEDLAPSLSADVRANFSRRRLEARAHVVSPASLLPQIAGWLSHERGHATRQDTLCVLDLGARTADKLGDLSYETSLLEDFANSWQPGLVVDKAAAELLTKRAALLGRSGTYQESLNAYQHVVEVFSQSESYEARAFAAYARDGAAAALVLLGRDAEAAQMDGDLLAILDELEFDGARDLRLDALSRRIVRWLKTDQIDLVLDDAGAISDILSTDADRERRYRAFSRVTAVVGDLQDRYLYKESLQVVERLHAAFGKPRDHNESVMLALIEASRVSTLDVLGLDTAQARAEMTPAGAEVLGLLSDMATSGPDDAEGARARDLIANLVEQAGKLLDDETRGRRFMDVLARLRR